MPTAQDVERVHRALEKFEAAERHRRKEERRIARGIGRTCLQILNRLLPTLVRRRKALGLRVTEVARRMGVRRPAVSRLERLLAQQNPSLETLARYAAAVGATIRVTLLPGVWRKPPLGW